MVSLWLVPFVLQYLSKPEYGIFAILSDLLAWLAIANLGVTATFNASGAQLLGTKDFKELSIVASTTFYTQLISALLILLLGYLIVRDPGVLFSEVDATENIWLFSLLVLAGFVINYASQPLNSILVADKQIHINNYLKFGLLVIQTSLTVILLTSGYKLLSLAISNLVANIIIAIIAWIRVKKSLPALQISPGYWRGDRLQYLVKNGIWFTVGGIAGILIFRMDAFLIGKYISLAMVANFIITIKLYQIATTFHNQFFNTARPYFAQVFGRKEMGTLNSMYNLCFYASFGLAFFMGGAIYLINGWFIHWWVGPGFYLGDTINLLLCINFIVQAAVLPNRILLATSLYKIRLHNLTRIFEGLAKLGLSVLFIQIWGINALITAAILASMLFSNLLLNYLSSKLLQENWLPKLQVLAVVLVLPLLFLIDVFLYKILFLLALFLLLCWMILAIVRDDLNLIPPVYAKAVSNLFLKKDSPN